MSMIRFQHLSGSLLIAGAILGCGSGDQGGVSETPANAAEKHSQEIQTAEGTPSPGESVKAITASIESPAKATVGESIPGSTDSDKTPEKSPFPDDDATKTLKEVQRLRIAPLPADTKDANAARRERNERIVEMATKVLRMTMDEESRKPQFHQAIGQLLEARFQLAMLGSKAEIDQLYTDVQALNDRDPKSVAAAEGVYTIAKFAHTQAGLHGKAQPVWFETLSRWAREFADRFPEQTQRAVSLLFGAARSCELHANTADDSELSKRLMTECKLCYTTLAEKFGKTEQGQNATASLRRLSLVGQQLSQFAGPTADGGFVSADEFPGKPTLIYFWESDSPEFSDGLLPVLEKISSQWPSDQLRIVGVALDEDESTLNSFMEMNNVPGQQIFFPNVQQRSWDSPLIRFWGVARAPSVWLIDAKGKVVSTTATAKTTLKELQSMLKP